MGTFGRDSLNLAQADGSAQPPVAQVPANESVERTDIDLLFRRVTELQTRANEADKPWYRSPSTTIPIAISVLALAGSILIPVTENREASRQRAQEQLMTDVGQIVDLRKENTERLASGTNPMLSWTESQLLNEKNQVLQEKAKDLLKDPQLNAKADPAIVRVLASEVGLSGDVSVAKQLLQEVLKRKDVGGWEQASTTAVLGYWQMVSSATPNEIADGRRNMQQAVALYQQQGGEYSKEALIQAYLSWVTQELVVNNSQGAKQELQAARIWLDRLHPLNTNKPFLQSSYRAAERLIDSSQAGVPAGSTDADIDRWYGTWTMNTGPAAERSGPLILSWNKQTNLVDARLDLFEHHALVEKYVGSGSFLDARTLRIDWLGVVRPVATPGYPPAQTYGYTELRLDDTNRLAVTTYLLGEPAVTGLARKARLARSSGPG